MFVCETLVPNTVEQNHDEGQDHGLLSTAYRAGR